MEIHNLMEDLVKQTVNDIFDATVKGSASDFCTCYQCRMDVACYALNRMKPDYVISSRGVAYGENDYGEKLQRVADIATLVREGWTKINHAKRPHFEHSSGNERPAMPEGAVFNFPAIMGRLFNGLNFAPLSGLTVSLFRGESLVQMMDPNWENPSPLVKNTTGTFIFWPYPEHASAPGEKQSFPFSIQVKEPGFEEFEHFFELALVSEAVVSDTFSMQRTHKIADLYLFPK